MSSIEESVEYTYSADTDNYEKNVNNASKANKNFEESNKKTIDSTDRLNSSISSAKNSIVPFVGAISAASVGIIAFGNAADTAVGNIAKMEAVFADTEEKMNAVTIAAENLGNQLGIATNEIILTGSAMAVTAQNMGFAEEQAEKYGAAVAKLSAVSASYLNIPMAEAAERVTAAMRGEAEAAEALGLSLGQTAMIEFVNQQIAAGSAIKKTYGEMNTQEQMIIRLIAAIDQMANTMGVATPEVYTLAEAEKVLTDITKAASKEVTIQQKVTAELKDTFNKLLVAIQPVKDALAVLIGVTLGYITVILEAIATNEHYAKVLKLVTITIFAVITAIGILIGIILIAIDTILDFIATNEQCQKIIEIVTKTIVILAVSISALIIIILNVIDTIINWIMTNEELQQLLINIGNIIVILTTIIGSLISIVAIAIANFVEWISQTIILQSALQAIGMILEDIATIINRVITNTKENIAAFKEWASESELLQKVLATIEKTIKSISNAIQVMIDWINKAIDAFQDIRAQDFGSDLVNLGASASGASAQQATFSSIPSLTGGIASVTNSTTNTFNISPRQTMSYRDAYRQGQLAKARGGL